MAQFAIENLSKLAQFARGTEICHIKYTFHLIVLHFSSLSVEQLSQFKATMEQLVRCNDTQQLDMVKRVVGHDLFQQVQSKLEQQQQQQQQQQFAMHQYQGKQQGYSVKFFEFFYKTSIAIGLRITTEEPE